MKHIRAYTTRTMPKEILDRVRVLAAERSESEGRRVTMEWMVAEVLRKGLPLMEQEMRST